MLFILFVIFFIIFDEIPHRQCTVSCFRLRTKKSKQTNHFNHNEIINKSQFDLKFKLSSYTPLNNLPHSGFISTQIPSTSTIHSYILKTTSNPNRDLPFSRNSNTSSGNRSNKSNYIDRTKQFSEKFFGDGSYNINRMNEGDPYEMEGLEETQPTQPYDTRELVAEPPWTPGDDLELPYMTDEKLKLSIDKWPENCFLRIKLFSYYKHLVKLAVDRIQLALKDNDNLRVTNAMALPMRRKRWCYLSSAFIDKRSKDLIEIQEHTRVVDIVPLRNSNVKKFKGILMVPLPDFVSFDYWFEEAHKPVKNKMIHDLYRKRRWVSKYFLYHRDKHKKKELIDKITSPELINEIPLRLRKQHKLDYYFYQVGELRKLYNFIVARKAEDDARRFYNVRMPEIWEVDDVRFIGNYEDRQNDPDYTNIDKSLNNI